MLSTYLKIPMLVTAMGQDIKRSNHYLPFLKMFRLDVVPISSFQLKFIGSPRQSSVRAPIPFGVELSYFNQKPVERSVDIIGVGSLNTIKNYPEFIEIIEIIAQSFPLVCVRIAGKGDQQEVMERMIREKGLEKNIELLGERRYEEVILLMHSAKILLHTSTFEGQALVITEGLAAGLKVIAHPVGIAAGLQAKKLLTGTSKEDLVGLLLRSLSEPMMDFGSEVYFRNEETISAYLEIWE